MHRIDKQFELEKLKLEASQQSRIREQKFMRSMFAMFQGSAPLPTPERRLWSINPPQPATPPVLTQEHNELLEGFNDLEPFDLGK